MEGMMEIGTKSLYTAEGLTQRIIECIIKVHQGLGPGFLEYIYHNALIIELCKHGLSCDTQKDVAVFYDGKVVGHHKLDLLIENQVVVELKTVEQLSKAHYAQLRSYLRATGLQIGLLVNFASDKADFRRVDIT